MLLPDAEGYLLPASQLCFNDADWCGRLLKVTVYEKLA
jgi:hypothetical protein